MRLLETRVYLFTVSFQQTWFILSEYEEQWRECVSSRMRAMDGRGTELLWPSVQAPGPAWAAGSCWNSAPPLWTTRTFLPGHETDPTASAWWCDAGHLGETHFKHPITELNHKERNFVKLCRFCPELSRWLFPSCRVVHQKRQTSHQIQEQISKWLWNSWRVCLPFLVKNSLVYLPAKISFRGTFPSNSMMSAMWSKKNKTKHELQNQSKQIDQKYKNVYVGKKHQH